MFDYNDLMSRWDDDERYEVLNNFIRTCHMLDVWRRKDNQNIKGSYYEKEWMIQLHWNANEFIDTLTKLGLTPNGSRAQMKYYFWKTLNPF